MISEIAFTICALLALALAGGFVLVPFRGNFRFLLLLAPACGILILSLVVGLIYSMSGKPFEFAVVLAFTVTSLLTAATLFKWRPSREELVVGGIFVIVIGTLATLFGCGTSIRFGSPGILFIDGSDHAGYAPLADWFVMHTIKKLPVLSPDKPYESWPYSMVQNDPRLGAFLYLAIVSWVRKLPGLFAYDPAVSVALASGIIAVAGAFARTRKTLVLIAICLVMSGWEALGRQGYLGKILGYPCALMIVGLFLNSTRRDAIGIAVLCLLAVSTAVVHAGTATALLLLVTTGAIAASRWRQSKDDLVAALMLTFVALTATGMFALPRGSPAGLVDLDWNGALAVALDIDTGFRFMSHSYQSASLMLAVFLQLLLIAFAARARSWSAFALASAAMILFVALRLDDQKWITYELVGVPYPLGICTAAYLFDQCSNDVRRSRIVLAIAVAMALMRVPLMPRMLNRYLISPPPGQQYLLSEFDDLQRAIGQKPVEIDISDPNPAILVLVEFGRRNLNVQWSPAGWNRVLAYRHWPAPQYKDQPACYLGSKFFPLVKGTPLLSTGRFVLYRNVQPLAGEMSPKQR